MPTDPNEPSPAPALTLHWQYDLADLADAARVVRRPWQQALAFAPSAMAVMLVGVAWANGFVVTAGAFAVVAAALLVRTRWRQRAAVARQWRLMADLHPPMTCEIDSRGIRMHNQRRRMDRRWADVAHCVTTRRSYLLFTGPGAFVVIPRRAFQTSMDEQQFIALLSR